MVGLQNELHSPASEPLPGILMAKNAKSPLHQIGTTRINFRQIINPLKRVGQIASSATGNSDLRQRLASSLKHNHLGRGKFLPQMSRTKNSSGTGTNDYYGHRLSFSIAITSARDRVL